MSRSVNKVILVGRLGMDVAVSYLPSGQSVAKFSLATSRSFKDKSGNWQEETEWHNIVAWGKTGESCGEYLKKGSQAFIEGRIQTRTWEDKQGHKQKTTEIIAETVVFLGEKRSQEHTEAATPFTETPDSDSIPF